MKTSEQINEIAKALCEMQATMNPAKKGGVNPYFKSKYATLEAVWNAIREPLHENGLSVVQSAESLPEGISVVTKVMHTSGQWIECGPLVIPMAKSDPHSTGSGISYGKRYGLAACLGIIAEEDDDGNKAQKASEKKEEIKTVITEKQYLELKTLLKGHEDLEAKILEWAQVPTLDKLKQSLFDTAKKSILKRKKATA